MIRRPYKKDPKRGPNLENYPGSACCAHPSEGFQSSAAFGVHRFRSYGSGFHSIRGLPSKPLGSF